MSALHSEINLAQYTLPEFNALKLATPSIEVIFSNEASEEIVAQCTHARCTDVIYPFAWNQSAPIAIPIKHACKLVEADMETRVKEVMEITLDATLLPDFDYAPGDTIAILPQNSESDVQRILRAMDLMDKANHEFSIRASASHTKKPPKLPHIPQCLTPRELLRHLLNLRAVPKKQFLRGLAECCSSIDERDFLNCLASKEGTKFYNDLLLEQGLTLCDLLDLCITCQPTLALLIEHLPRLLPRPYSIANSSIQTENELKIIFSILTERPGVTTSMLTELAEMVMQSKHDKLDEPPKVLVYYRQPSNFRYTALEAVDNQILIAIGTGLAPFLGFLAHKMNLIQEESRTFGNTWLFAGAATEASLPKRELLLEYQERGVLQRYFECFSRVPDASYHYVQEQLIANSQALVEFLMQSDTSLYVCADGARISSSIEAALITCLQAELQLSQAEAKEMLKEFRLNGKYREDLWT